MLTPSEEPIPAAYTVVIRENTRNAAKLAGKSLKAPGARTSLILSNSPATKRRRLGLTAGNIRRHLNTASKGRDYRCIFTEGVGAK